MSSNDCNQLPAKLEFELNDLDKNQSVKLKECLMQLKGVSSVDLRDSRVYVNTCLPTSTVHEKLEKCADTLAVLRGMGSGIGKDIENLDAAVCEFSDNIKGVIRFVQLDQEHCAIDGVVDGLEPGGHAINVCEFGDLSEGCKSCGNHFNPYNKSHGLPTDEERHVGDLGNIEANEHGRATFRIVDKHLKLWDVIGRSVCISEKPDRKYNDTGERLACGIIARSARIFENIKQICACSGRTLWDERVIQNKSNNNSKTT